MNPFKVLNLKKNVLSKEIIQAVAIAMREKKYSAKELAQAQKLLLDPVSRACQEFLHFIDLGDIKEKLIQEITETSGRNHNLKTSDCLQLKCLTIFEKDHDI